MEGREVDTSVWGASPCRAVCPQPALSDPTNSQKGQVQTWECSPKRTVCAPRNVPAVSERRSPCQNLAEVARVTTMTHSRGLPWKLFLGWCKLLS